VACGHDTADLIRALLGSAHADIRPGTRAKALRQLGANLEAVLGFRMDKSLGIGIRNKELDALKPGRHHVVDSVATGSADTQHKDARAKFREVR
jgi:hypothetical protein